VIADIQSLAIAEPRACSRKSGALAKTPVAVTTPREAASRMPLLTQAEVTVVVRVDNEIGSRR